jgi:flagellar motor protein MotB
MAKDPFASTPDFSAGTPSKLFSPSRVIAFLIGIGAVTFALAYYVPLSSAHSALAQAHDSLSSSNAGTSMQLEKTTQQLMDTQKQRDEFSGKLKALDDAKESAASAITEASGRIKEKLGKLASGKQVEINEQADGVALVLDYSKLFRPTEVSVNPAGRKLLCAIAPGLKDLEAEIEVRGYTAQADVKNAALKTHYQTGWELSAVRAAGALRVLESCGVAADRMRAVGYANHRLPKPLDKASEGAIYLWLSPKPD